MLPELSLLLALILLNGAFAMSEIAVVGSRRARLVQLSESGSTGARHALALAAEPTRFLSSVQIGITTIGILSGAIGEATIANRLRIMLEEVPVLAGYADTFAVVLMVVGLTYVSLILGELAPKRLALTRPEAIASVIARPMQVVAAIGRPLVYILSVSTDTVLALFGVRKGKEPAVTHEEVKLLIAQGTEQGVFEQSEQEMVTNVLNLDERRVESVLTPRSAIVFLDVRDTPERSREQLRKDSHDVLPLCDGGLDHVVGFVRSTRVLDQLLERGTLDLPALAERPLFVPESMTLMKLLEQFKRTHLPLALAIDEFGEVEGLVSLTDVVSSIVGDLPAEPGDEPMIVPRDDGSWLLDGALDLDTLFRTLRSDSLVNDEERQRYHTVGGLVMLSLGRVPRTGDMFERGAFRFEVVDMDGNRVDRVLVSPKAQQAVSSEATPGTSQ
jgi:putative hemolysin